MWYTLTRNGELFGIAVEPPYGLVSQDISIHEMDEAFPDLNARIWDPVNDCFVDSANVTTKYELTHR